MAHKHIDFLLLQHFEKDFHYCGKFRTIDCFVSVLVQQVEDVLNVIHTRTIASDEFDERPDDFWELVLGEAVVVICIELAEYFFHEWGYILAGEFSEFLLFVWGVYCFRIGFEVGRVFHDFNIMSGFRRECTWIEFFEILQFWVV